MRSGRRRRLRVAMGALSLGLLALVAPASGHDVWLEPSYFRTALGETVSLDIRVGESFRGESVPLRPGRIDGFWVNGEGVDEPIRGVPGLAPAGALRVPSNAAGLIAVHYRSRMAEVALSVEAFAEHAFEQGLEHLLHAAPTAPLASRVVEAYSRCASTLIRVEGGVATSTSGLPRRPECPLTLWPVEGSVSLRDKVGVELLLRFKGRPVANGLVVALNRAEPSRRVERRTDGRGLVTMPIDGSGIWMVKSVHMEPADGDDVDWRSWWVSLTFEVESH